MEKFLNILLVKKMNILQSNQFKKQVKKIHKNQKKDLDNAIFTIIENPLRGEEKKGTLKGLRVYKFKMQKQLTLLGYFYPEKNTLILTSVSSHENFYRDISL